MLYFKIKKDFWIFEDIIWNVRCRFYFWLYGPYGLTRTIEKVPFRFLIKYMQKYGAQIGTGVIIDSGIKFHRPDKKIPLKNLIIGNNVYIGHNILLDLTEKIIIQNNIGIGANCQIWTHVGDFVNELRDNNDYYEKAAAIIVNDGAVIYSNVILNPGVELGRKSRILAMSMVSGKIPENQIWAGVPAKFIKERNI